MTLGNVNQLVEVLGRSAASAGFAAAVAVTQEQGATIAAAPFVDGDPAAALINIAAEPDARAHCHRGAARTAPWPNDSSESGRLK